MKKILVVFLIEVLIFSGSGILTTVHSEKNDIYGLSNDNFLDDTCGCNDILKSDNYMDFYEYSTMDMALYIDSSVVQNPPKIPLINTPDEFSWKNFDGQDWTTPAKSQGNCGSCWDFAAIGTLESIIKIREENSKLSPDLSEQYVLSCLPAAANTYGEGCWGGTPYKAFYYMMVETSQGNNKNGAIPESCFPYQASDDIPCEDKCENWEELLVPILDCNESYLGFDSPENRAIIKSLMYQYGPIAAGMNVSQDFIDFWNTHHDPNDYFPDPNAPWGNRLNHIIVILGWKDDPSINNGGYWICKNSWGTPWGYEGFFNIEYGGLFTGYYISMVDYDPDNYNWPPTVPIINGPYEGVIGIEYDYEFLSEDQDGDSHVYYYIDWDDDTNSDWVGPFISGEEVTISHTWSKTGTFTIRAKSKDTNSSESDWATLTITIPRNKAISNNFLLRFLERYPIFNRLLSITGII